MRYVLLLDYLSYLTANRKGFGTVGCHRLGLLGGRLRVPALFSESLSTLSMLFDSLHVLQLFPAEWISLLRMVFIALSLHLPHYNVDGLP